MFLLDIILCRHAKLNIRYILHNYILIHNHTNIHKHTKLHNLCACICLGYATIPGYKYSPPLVFWSVFRKQCALALSTY